MKRTIRLTESDLHKVISEAVKRVLIESGGHRYKIVAHLIYPHTDWQNKSLGDDYQTISSDYDFISDESNPEQERIQRLMKYQLTDSFGGTVEMYPNDAPYFIDEDGDGLYLMKRID